MIIIIIDVIRLNICSASDRRTNGCDFVYLRICYDIPSDDIFFKTGIAFHHEIALRMTGDGDRCVLDLFALRAFRLERNLHHFLFLFFLVNPEMNSSNTSLV
jgi:hypothetical protein